MTRKGSRTIIVMYHHVGRAGRYGNRSYVHPDRLAEHIELLRRSAEIVPLRSVLERSKNRRVAVTFDDGYVDVVQNAKPVLEAAGIPATVFVVAGMVGSPTEFWWHRLEHLIEGLDGREALDIDLAGRDLWIGVTGPGGRERAYDALRLRLREVAEPEREAFLTKLASRSSRSWHCRDTHTAVTSSELVELSASDTIELGSHTISHPWLGSLPTDAQQAEITDSRSLLQQAAQGTVSTFAYPYGGSGSFNETTVALVRRAGYSLACTTEPAPVPDRPDAFRLPRYDVGDWHGSRFAMLLSDWLSQ